MRWDAEQMEAMERQLDRSEALMEAHGINPDCTTWTAEDQARAYEALK